MTNCENSRRVAIAIVLLLLYNNFEYKRLCYGSDSDGNLLYADINTGSLSMRIINIYAPKLDTPSFFSKC